LSPTTGTPGRCTRLTFVSTNEGKYREVAGILAAYGVDARWSRRVLPEIQADRLEDVVETKLRAATRRREWILVEDSGLFLRGLEGFPGVYSSFVFRTIGSEGVLRALTGRSRQAVFRTVAGLTDGKRRWFFVGECRGTISTRPMGVNGFGFDPIFIAHGRRDTFGQMPTAEKNRLSHRARAIRRVSEFLRQPP
jgi:XTP/dITP diphosphohydrolase